MTLISEIESAQQKIYRDGYDMSFGELTSLYERKELIIRPEYQRLFRWDESQKTRFIESVLLNIPIPPIFVFANPKGIWELVDGLQRLSTILEFMGLLRAETGDLKSNFRCLGTNLLPSLNGTVWPKPNAEESENDLPMELQLNFKRARIRVEILGKQTATSVKYELFQRLNTGGSNLSPQEIRNVTIISINKDAFRKIEEMSNFDKFNEVTATSEARREQQYPMELVVRFLVLRNMPYDGKLDVNEYLDRGIIQICENEGFDWDHEEEVFKETFALLATAAGDKAFRRTRGFTLALYEFITLGVSKAVDRKQASLTADFLRERIKTIQTMPELDSYTGAGVRGTDRIGKFVMTLAIGHFQI